MNIPARFSNYRCSDYFESDTFTRGVWSESEQLWLVVSAEEIMDRKEHEFLVIGRPGVDGIEFGYRRDHDGIWAYHPIDNNFTLGAPSVGALVDGWFAGSIGV